MSFVDNSTSAYIITVGEPHMNGIIANSFEEALIFTGRLIERLHTDEEYAGRFIYIFEYHSYDNGTYIRQNDLFYGHYLIEK